MPGFPGAAIYIWRYYTCVPTSASRFSFKMLTLYDLLEIVGNDKKLTKWMKNYNIVRDFFFPPRTRYSSRRGLEGVKQEGGPGESPGTCLL